MTGDGEIEAMNIPRNYTYSNERRPPTFYFRDDYLGALCLFGNVTEHAKAIHQEEHFSSTVLSHDLNLRFCFVVLSFIAMGGGGNDSTFCLTPSLSFSLLVR